LSERIHGNQATVAVASWDPEEQPRLAARLEAQVEAEPLGLEDIFVKLHS
jgi:hypothetical protein